MSRRLTVIAAVAGLAVVAAAPAAAASPARFPTELALPAGFQPEGIAIAGATAYFGSRADGDIYAIDLKSGKGRTLAEGPGTPSLGLKARDGRLWVSGGTAGDARVVDLRSGRTVASYKLSTEADTFVNDVALTSSGAWFTDSRKAVLYNVNKGRVSTLPLTGLTITPGAVNLNGIVDSPDGRSLLVVQSNTGQLHRVNPRTGATSVVDTGGYALTNGDGLLRIGRSLYVAQNRLNTVAELTLSRDGSTAALAATATDPRFDIPTTIAAFADRLYLPNARFSTPPTPETAYNVIGIPRT